MKLSYFRQFGLAGKVTLSGRTYDALISDNTCRGDFLGSGDASILIDLNGNGKVDRDQERFVTSDPFVVDGVTYQIVGLKPGGVTCRIVKVGQ
jgi:hypothetical protein